MKVARRDGVAVIVIDDSAPVHYCKPAVDPLFASAAEVWGSWNLALILTGMGNDGTEGLLEMKTGGAYTIAQDEASCVVFGMPKEAIERGAVDRVVHLAAIAATILKGHSADKAQLHGRR